MPTRTRESLALDVPPELYEAWNRHPEIVKLGDPVLEQVAKPVTHFRQETIQLVEDMKRIMKKARGLGLAAPQIGASTRILIYDVGDGVQVIVNPKILSMRGEQLDPPEGCLSIPGLQGQVRRAKEVRVKGYNQLGRPVYRRAQDMEARVIQHELDHLDGILFFERADQDTLEWLIDSDEDDENGAPRE
jgi:peptide deformylase